MWLFAAQIFLSILYALLVHVPHSPCWPYPSLVMDSHTDFRHLVHLYDGWVLILYTREQECMVSVASMHQWLWVDTEKIIASPLTTKMRLHLELKGRESGNEYEDRQQPRAQSGIALRMEWIVALFTAPYLSLPQNGSGGMVRGSTIELGEQPCLLLIDLLSIKAGWSTSDELVFFFEEKGPYLVYPPPRSLLMFVFRLYSDNSNKQLKCWFPFLIRQLTIFGTRAHGELSHS